MTRHQYRLHNLWLGLLLLLVSLTVAAADQGFYIETMNRGSAVMGEQPIESLTKTYIAHDKMKVVNSGPDASSMILDPKAGLMTFVSDADQQYFQIDVQKVMQAMADPRMAQMRKMIEETKIKVEDTGEIRKIGDWQCRLYRVTKQGMMELNQEIWATEDVDLDVAPFTQMMNMSGANALPGAAGSDAQQNEMAKIKGYPILTKNVVNMMGSTIETETEVKLIRQEDIPEGFFEIPQGYTLREMGSGGMSAPPTQAPHP